MSVNSLESPLIYVVLPVHNRINVTRKFVRCLLSQTYHNYHLILIDDGCVDGTPEYVQDAVEELTVLHGNGSLWWAGSLQKAYLHLKELSHSDRDIVYISNDDTSFDCDYFARIIADPDLDHRSLVVSPGYSRTNDFIEYGFKIDWDDMRIEQLKKHETPDAITTRGLYMYYETFINIGGFPHRLLPHYLSDLEYTVRAKRKGYRLVVSSETHICVDRSTTGIHQPADTGLLQFLHSNLISKKSAFNSTHWTWFALLAAPPGKKMRCVLLVVKRFIRKTLEFIRN